MLKQAFLAKNAEYAAFRGRSVREKTENFLDVQRRTAIFNNATHSGGLFPKL
jgi:hypothetical protein